MTDRKRKSKAVLLFFVLIISIISGSDAKGGRGGGFSRGGGSSRGGSSGGSKSGGWSLFGGSKPSPSYSAPSYKAPSYSAPSYKAPSYSAPSYSAPSHNPPSYGWNTNRANTGSSNANPPSYGWNVNNNNAAKPSAPIGPPPAYPGLQNRPVPNSNSPPAYSPGSFNPPAYSPSHNQPSYNPGYQSRPSSSGSGYYGGGNTYQRGNSYNTYSGNPGYNSGYNPNQAYGSSFGSQGIPSNTYVYNNYYGNQRSGGGSGFLTNALFYGAGTHHGYMWGNRNSHNRNWDEDEDRRWRRTTKAPYFENKVPGEDKILPASAVIGAATAFGLVSLLPLKVPANKPLMYCNNDTTLQQAQIQLNNENIYRCVNTTLEISCRKILENGTSIDECKNTAVNCDLNPVENEGKNIYCTNGTLLSKNPIFCNSSTILNGTNVNETTTILNCYEGDLPDSQASFVPTTTTTEAPTTTTEKSLSIKAKMHIFLLKLIGKYDVLEKTESTTQIPDIPQLSINESSWTPEALTIPPETTTTTTTEGPFEWMMKVPHLFENGTYGTTLRPVPKGIADIITDNKYFNGEVTHAYVKVPITTTTTTSETASESTAATTETASESTTITTPNES